MLAAPEYEGTRPSGYLDTATYGLPPRSTIAALEDAVRGWREWEDWSGWERDGERCRELFGSIVGARPTSVALVGAVSAAAGVVAASLPARRGDNVVCYEHEFQSALFPGLVLEERGVEVRLRPLRPLRPPSTRGQSSSRWAPSSRPAAGSPTSTRSRTPGRPCFSTRRSRPACFPVALEGVDFLVAGGYKWLLCPQSFSPLSRYPLAERCDSPSRRSTRWSETSTGTAGESSRGWTRRGLPALT